MILPRFAGRHWVAGLLVLVPLFALEYLVGESLRWWEVIAWVTPLLWLVFFQQARALVAYVVGVLGLLLVYSTQHTVNTLTGPAFHLTNLVIAVTYLLPFLLRRVLATRVPAAGRWLLLPLAAVSVEYGLALGPNGTWGSVGYSQSSVYLLQLTAWTGIYGVTFLLYAVASLLFETRQQRQMGQRVRQLGAADLVFAPAADWPGIREPHARMAATRAVENGFALFRIAGQGKSSLTTAYGEVVRSQYHLAPEVKALIATVPVQRLRTFYQVWGDVFAWLCLGSLLGLVVVGRWLR